MSVDIIHGDCMDYMRELPDKAFDLAIVDPPYGISEPGKIHPTQKPVKLYLWLLEKFATAEMSILDTHLGSGSSAIAAHQFGSARFVGIEKNAVYIAAARNRFTQETAQQQLFS